MTLERHSAVPAWRRLTIPPLAGLGYSLSWVVGLVIFSSSTDVRSSGADLIATYAGHRGVAIAQVVLTEGTTAIALALVVWAFARAAQAAGERQIGRTILATGPWRRRSRSCSAASGSLSPGGSYPTAGAGLR